jgi:hypothetical protein
MTTTNHLSRHGQDGAGISVQWSDAVSESSVAASLLGAILRVHIDPDGTVTIRGIEDSVPSSYRAPDVYSPSRSLNIHMSFTSLELLLDSAKQAIKDWKQEQNRIKRLAKCR